MRQTKLEALIARLAACRRTTPELISFQQTVLKHTEFDMIYSPI
jgi:hypothetical protein